MRAVRCRMAPACGRLPDGTPRSAGLALPASAPATYPLGLGDRPTRWCALASTRKEDAVDHRVGNIRRTLQVVVAASAVVVAFAGPAAAPVAARTPFKMYDAGVLGTSSIARDVNAKGHVAGSYTTRDGNIRALASDGRRLIDLGPGEAYAINDNDQVAGYEWLPDGTMEAFVTVDGSKVQLGQGMAEDVNDAGQVVGVSNGHPFMWDGTLHDLGTLDGGGFAHAINNVGQIVGESEWGIPFLYDATGLHDVSARITAAGGGLYRIWGLWDINDHGQVIGLSSPMAGGTGEAFTYNLNTGVFRLLPQLIPGDFTYPGGINDNGDIVGWARPVGTSGSGIIHAVLWTGSSVQDLGTLGGGTSDAYAINDAGLITGSAAKRSGMEHIFLLSTR